MVANGTYEQNTQNGLQFNKGQWTAQYMTMLRNRTYNKVAFLNVAADQTLFTIHISVLRASLFQTPLDFILQLWDGKGSIQNWSTTHFKRCLNSNSDT